VVLFLAVDPFFRLLFPFWYSSFLRRSPPSLPPPGSPFSVKCFFFLPCFPFLFSTFFSPLHLTNTGPTLSTPPSLHPSVHHPHFPVPCLSIQTRTLLFFFDEDWTSTLFTSPYAFSPLRRTVSDDAHLSFPLIWALPILSPANRISFG